MPPRRASKNDDGRQQPARRDGPVSDDAYLAPLLAVLETELARDGFARMPGTPPIVFVMRRKKLLGDKHIVAVVQAEKNFHDLPTLTTGYAVQLRAAIGDGNIVMVWVGSDLEKSATGIETALGGDTAIRGIFVVDLAARRVTLAGNKVAESTQRLRDRVGKIVQATLDATGTAPSS